MKKLKKKCIILDHDDTLINSQETIHYPIFLETLDLLRPNVVYPSFLEFVTLSNQYGFEGYIKSVYQFNDDEVTQEVAMWRQKVKLRQAQAFEEVAIVIQEFVQSNGILVVYSYSDSDMILKDYQRIFDFEPHEIIGFDNPKHLQKPNRLPILQIMAKYNLSAHDCLLIDDMPLLIETAKRLNVDMIGANWAKGSQVLWNKKHHDLVTLCHDASCLYHSIFKD